MESGHLAEIPESLHLSPWIIAGVPELHGRGVTIPSDEERPDSALEVSEVVPGRLSRKIALRMQGLLDEGLANAEALGRISGDSTAAEEIAALFGWANSILCDRFNLSSPSRKTPPRRGSMAPVQVA